MFKVKNKKLDPSSQQREGGGRGRVGGCLPCSFLKIGKSTLILEKNALIVSIHGLKVPFKMQFQEYLGEKSPIFSLRGLFFLCFWRKAYRSVLIRKTSPVLKNFWLHTWDQIVSKLLTLSKWFTRIPTTFFLARGTFLNMSWGTL